MRVVQYGVHDPAYPRNERIRAFLSAELGADVTVLERRRSGSRLRRAVQEVVDLWRASRGADVIVLSEFRLTHAPLVWAVARLRRARFVVDHFVGLHETVVEDWRKVHPKSSTARRLAVQDALAARLADLCLTDTQPRAARLAAMHGRPVLALPVGAPSWARPSATPRAGVGPAAAPDADRAPLRVLYYGNYLPLHGVPEIVGILAELVRHRAVAATFIGDGLDRSTIERSVRTLGLAGCVEFLDPVPEAELVRQITAHDVVLGVFGDSRKARDVVPNKVWQGLACGKTTVTGDGPAVRELHDVVGDQLVIVGRGEPVRAAEAIVAAASRTTDTSTAHERLEQYTRTAYRRLAEQLRNEGS
ncbi:glycosyltransferase [Curtobacterium luteum]|uniref:glycosyltransferase n=1 Tax=Curtobacterium luteum TaxID=33881 RepID=UPI0007378B81|nr:glycosyltransferase [Curtobacterium luteum]